ncbi:ribosomal protein S18 acetylase RimI-like enzyme [Flavobacterium sp. 9]|uniref:GNAT family N-acetyltransferase n=1 Tax=Flavobacterium sp. 9 TaxID=2035198 RepID=UPI000C198D04|nr:GNAT family N-acetyltransferase [Flavobacterium sp. 9]PIF30592.1 ribosomal protein S18 acetylase RimI-like enzyme [Flavobacterium sp. 9]
MKIVPIRKSDYDSLRKLFLKERQNTFHWLDPLEFKLNDFDRYTKGEFILVAILEDIPVGFISIWMKGNFIHHLYIDQNQQGKGIGTELLKAAIQKTKLPITLKCLENNTKAVEFYLKKGFFAVERGQSEHGGYILFELLKKID